MEKLKKTLFSFGGRISRKTFWLYTILLLILYVVLSFLFSALFGLTPFYSFGSVASYGRTLDDEIIQEVMKLNRKSEWAWLLAELIVLVPMATIYIKRRHDRGAKGYEFWIGIAFSMLFSLLAIMGIIYEVKEYYGWFMVFETSFAYFLLAIMVIITIYMTIVAGFLKGDEGENAYGNNPLQDN